MKSKIVQQIEDETPEYIDTFVDIYADLLLEIDKISSEIQSIFFFPKGK